MNLEGFTIAELMIHDVPRGNNPVESLVLTDDPVVLDPVLQQYFQNKILGSLNARGIEVIPDFNEDETVRKAMALIISQPAKLVSASREIAERLNRIQNGKNPAGLLAIASGTIDGKGCVSVLKLEREQGLRFRINKENSRISVDLEYLRDLTLTDKTKVFKTSLFIAEGNGLASPISISGRVSDDQRSSNAATGVANFFLTAFLGCRLRDSPEKTTLAFVEATYLFINEDITDPEKRGNYQLALLTTIQDQELEINPKMFGDKHLVPADIPEFLDRINNIGINPNVPFPKDNSLVKAKGFKMTFESGMVLVGNKEDLKERVKIRPEASPHQGVDINDAVKILNGR